MAGPIMIDETSFSHKTTENEFFFDSFGKNQMAGPIMIDETSFSHNTIEKNMCRKNSRRNQNTSCPKNTAERGTEHEQI